VRIVYLHQYYSTAIGGTRSYEMARRLVALGHEVHIVTSDTGPVPGRAPGWHATTESGIQVHSLPVPYSNWMGYGARIRAFLRFAWAASWKAASLGGDVVYATSTPLTIALPAIYAARKNRIPMVFEVRDLWPEAPIALGVLKSKATIAAARWLERVAYRHAAHVVALSPTMRAGIVATGYPQDRVTVVPNGCDDSVFDIGPEPGRSIRQQHAWLGDRPLVVYTGAVGRVNGVLYLARVASEARRADPELRFVVIGDGRETDVVREAAEQLGVLGQNFFMLPPVPKSEVARWLSAADIATSLVVDVPALWANSANKVFDAFAAGKPVAINYEGWQADLLREAGAGLILSARDHASAATTLIRTVRDSEWLVRAGHAARKLAQGRFNRDRLVAQVDDVLRHVVNGKRSSTTSAPTGTTATQPPEPPTVAPPTSAGPRIYLSPPHLSGSEQRHVAEAFASNWITSSGPQIEAFEQEFSSVIGGLPAVALSSGTAALHLGLRLAGVGPGDEVLVSTLTFVASVNPILYLGATPVFVDSERISWNMDPALLAEAIEASVRRRGRPPKAVIVVHLYGQSADLDAVREICNRHEIALIEDAAEALGATYKGRPPGTFGRVGIYSFNGNKIITTSGGGMLVSPDPALVAHARRLATQAREPAPHYEHREMGYNYRLSNILAGIGRSQLAVLAERVAARRRNFAWYVDALGGLPGVDFMPEAPWGTHSRWLTCLTIDPSKFGADREAVRLALEAENIEARPVWKPMHLQPVFAGHLRCGGSVAEDLFTRGLCLPSGSSLTLPDLARVAEIIQRTHRTRHE
jgi:pyridoxal phosphate-dependent aminotransferase EpsN